MKPAAPPVVHDEVSIQSAMEQMAEEIVGRLEQFTPRERLYILTHVDRHYCPRCGKAINDPITHVTHDCR